VCPAYTLNNDPAASTRSRAEPRRDLRARRKAQHRRLEQLIADDENAGVGSISDSVFFEQHPNRNYRLRLATPNESASMALIGCKANDSPDDKFDWMCIKQTAPGVRARMGLIATELSETTRSHIRLNRGHPETIFRVRVGDLKPQTTYYCTVTSMGSDGVSDGEKSPIKQFTTPGSGQRIMALPQPK
jgi:Fe-S oxidoreductase